MELLADITFQVRMAEHAIHKNDSTTCHDLIKCACVDLAEVKNELAKVRQ
jgi:hypothetical protein